MEITLEKLQEEIEENPEVKNYIDLALKDVRPEMKLEVFKFLTASRVKPNDPLFKLMLACHYFNLITLTVPQEIEASFDAGILKLLGKLTDTLEPLKRASVSQVEVEISKSVHRLLQQQDQTSLKYKWLKRGAIGLSGLFVLGLGAFVSYQYATMQYASTLEVENRQLLTWARSGEGRFAKQLMNWNPGLLDGSCSKNVARLGVGWGEVITKDGQIVGNRRASTGYCVVWRIPPEKRKFQ